MHFPLDDWQFWTVTAIAALIVAAACRNTIAAPRQKKSTRVTLTVKRTEESNDPKP